MVDENSSDADSSRAATNTAEMFTADDGTPNIIRKRELLEVGSVPDEDRIVGRDNEIEALVSNLRPIIRNDSPTPTLVFGKTGTGKSLTTRHVSMTAKGVASDQGISVANAYVDCS